VRVSDLARRHIFFAAQVVEIALDSGYLIRQRKIRLAITVDVDILRCPLETPGARSPTENPMCDTVSREAPDEPASLFFETTI
jgi:hypothetical protein